MMTSPRARRPLATAAGFGALAALVVAAACRAPQPAQASTDEPLSLAPTELSPRQAVQRLYPQIARGVGDTATVVLSFAPDGKLAAHRMTLRGQPAAGPIPPALRAGGRLESYSFAAGELGPDPVRVFVLRQLTAAQRRAAGALEADTVLVSTSSAVRGDTVQPVLVNGRDVSRALQQYYPPMLRDAGVTGSAEVQLRITAEGVVADTRVVRASHPALGDAAARALAVARFRPARSQGVAVASTFTLPVRFELSAEERPPVTAGVGAAWDEQPVPLNLDEISGALKAEYPPLLREAGITARAQVRLSISATGEVLEARAVSATHPDAGPAAERALARARFRPARKNGQPVAAEFVLPVVFSPGREQP